MRTTITLEDDVLATIRETMGKEKKSFKEAVNDLIRAGRYARLNAEKETQFELKGRMLKQRKNFNFDNISSLLEEIEGPNFK